jgi:signal transduction histidine kinase
VRDARSQPQRVVGVCTDITERKLAEEELRKSEITLRESENRFRTSVESLLDGFAILSAVRKNGAIEDFIFEYINETGCRLNRRSYTEHSGQRLLALLPELKENGIYDKYAQLVENGLPLEEEVEEYASLPASGQRLLRSFEVRAVQLGDGIVVTWRNITRRKQIEEQLKVYTEKLAQSNKELEQFAFVASHDLQEPLRKIKMFGNILHKQLHGQLPDQAEEYLIRMQNASARMEQMIQGLLELSRVNTRGGSFTQVDLTAVAQIVLSDLEPRLVSSAGRVIIEPLPTIQADALQMRQLFQNLLSNGLKFHQAGTPPVVRISGTLGGPLGGEPDRITLKVEDNGIGFEAQFAERIFQPFQRLHGRAEFEGTGMGLAICYRIVERHRGTITAHSQPGSGTTFLISLPARHL